MTETSSFTPPACPRCGTAFVRTSPNQQYCENCREPARRERRASLERERYQKSKARGTSEDAAQSRLTIVNIGEALYGSYWQTELAGSIGVNARTMRRWIADPESMPDTVWTELRALCTRRWLALIELSRASWYRPTYRPRL